ncbi:MAG: hypothetical protein NTW50_03685 [Candidatus Berkelbacteria bacterium]|nr:hypothetical protein [Candidatus Berkelbacteria bacterium]
MGKTLGLGFWSLVTLILSVASAFGQKSTLPVYTPPVGAKLFTIKIPTKIDEDFISQIGQVSIIIGNEAKGLEGKSIRVFTSVKPEKYSLPSFLPTTGITDNGIDIVVDGDASTFSGKLKFKFPEIKPDSDGDFGYSWSFFVDDGDNLWRIPKENFEWLGWSPSGEHFVSCLDLNLLRPVAGKKCVVKTRIVKVRFDEGEVKANASLKKVNKYFEPRTKFFAHQLVIFSGLRGPEYSKTIADYIAKQNLYSQIWIADYNWKTKVEYAKNALNDLILTNVFADKSASCDFLGIDIGCYVAKSIYQGDKKVVNIFLVNDNINLPTEMLAELLAPERICLEKSLPRYFQDYENADSMQNLDYLWRSGIPGNASATNYSLIYPTYGDGDTKTSDPAMQVYFERSYGAVNIRTVHYDENKYNSYCFEPIFYEEIVKAIKQEVEGKGLQLSWTALPKMVKGNKYQFDIDVTVRNFTRNTICLYDSPIIVRNNWGLVCNIWWPSTEANNHGSNYTKWQYQLAPGDTTAIRFKWTVSAAGFDKADMPIETMQFNFRYSYPDADDGAIYHQSTTALLNTPAFR